jgi:serine phosphatase RsbU (regulator of sigma subunit)
VAVERSYIDCQRDSLGIKNYQHLLATIQATTFDEQKNLLLQSLQQHQGHEPQRDDITVVGVEV